MELTSELGGVFSSPGQIVLGGPYLYELFQQPLRVSGQVSPAFAAAATVVPLVTVTTTSS